MDITKVTSVNWRSFCSEVCQFWLENVQKLAGPGVEVEIDETVIARRKYNRGRLMKTVWLWRDRKSLEEDLHGTTYVRLRGRRSQGCPYPSSLDYATHPTRINHLRWLLVGVCADNRTRVHAQINQPFWTLCRSNRSNYPHADYWKTMENY